MRLIFDHSAAHRQRKSRPPELFVPEAGILLLTCLFAEVQPLLFSGDLRFHLLYHLCQQPFALLFAVGVDVARVLFSVGPDRGVAALPELVVDL